MGIFEPRTYVGLSEDQIYSRICSDGGIPRLVKEDPGAIFDAHRNPCDLVLAFLRGSAEIVTSYEIVEEDEQDGPA